MSCVQLQGHLADLFDVGSGVPQEDFLSPILFTTFIDDLSEEVKAANAGVIIGREQLHDIVKNSPNVDKAQQQLDILSRCCHGWDMKNNARKSQV